MSSWGARMRERAIKNWWQITLVSVFGVLLLGALVQSLGNSIVAAGTLALAMVTFKTTIDADRQRQFERRPHIALKDMELIAPRDQHNELHGNRLVLRMFTNLGLHPLVIRYVSVHDGMCRSLMRVWASRVVQPGQMLPLADSRIDMALTDPNELKTMYDDQPGLQVDFETAYEEARWVRIVFQYGGMPGQDIHMWIPAGEQPDEERIFEHTRKLLLECEEGTKHPPTPPVEWPLGSRL